MKTAIGCILFCFLVTVVGLCSGSIGNRVNVGLAWDASPGTNVVGYNVYYGPAPRSYTNKVATAGLSLIITNLVGGADYYFTATAFTAEGLESEYCNEVSARLPWYVINPLEPLEVYLKEVDMALSPD